MCEVCRSRIFQTLDALENGQGEEAGELEKSINRIVSACKTGEYFVLDIRDFRMLSNTDIWRIRDALQAEILAEQVLVVVNDEDYARWWRRSNQEPPRTPRLAEAFRAATRKN